MAWDQPLSRIIPNEAITDFPVIFRSELKFLRIQLQAIEAQCSPQHVDLELSQSIMNWKVDWQDIDRRSKARRKKCHSAMTLGGTTSEVGTWYATMSWTRFGFTRNYRMFSVRVESELSMVRSRRRSNGMNELLSWFCLYRSSWFSDSLSSPTVDRLEIFQGRNNLCFLCFLLALAFRQVEARDDLLFVQNLFLSFSASEAAC